MATDRPDSTAPARGDRNVALLLTWFVPGAGHLYLGYWRFALAAFVVVEGMYWLGVQLSGGLFLEYLPAEMRGGFAWVLTPEVGNLGGLLQHRRTHPYLPDPAVYPSMMHLGTLLTALSGVLNLHLASRAHLDARLPQRERGRTLDPPWVGVATGLVPGLGQFLQGRKRRGVVIFILLVGLFVVGCWLAGGSNLDRERHFYYWGGQFLLGLPAIAAEFLHGHPLITADIPYADAGVVIACVAGMLNVLCVLDAFSFSEEVMTRGRPAAARGTQAGAAA